MNGLEMQMTLRTMAKHIVDTPCFELSCRGCVFRRDNAPYCMANDIDDVIRAMYERAIENAEVDE